MDTKVGTHRPYASASAYRVFSGAAGKAAELSAEAQAARDALSPTERLLHDMQAAFEAADVPFSEYPTLDARGLSRLLPSSIVARSARLLLETTWRRWAPRCGVGKTASNVARFGI